jgi:plasmid stability protein
MVPLWSHFMPNLSIKNVPEHVVAKLRQRATDHHRSLQGELLDLICRATEEDAHETTNLEHTNLEKEGASSGWLSIEEIAAEFGFSERKATTSVPLAVDIIRQDRDTR